MLLQASARRRGQRGRQVPTHCAAISFSHFLFSSCRSPLSRSVTPGILSVLGTNVFRKSGRHGTRPRVHVRQFRTVPVVGERVVGVPVPVAFALALHQAALRVERVRSSTDRPRPARCTGPGCTGPPSPDRSADATRPPRTRSPPEPDPAPLPP
jgi:hypothetical protein